MKKLEISLIKFDYCKLTEKEQQDILQSLYVLQELSWAEIAKLGCTYPNKLIRDAVKFGIPSRDKGEAQKLALKNGKSVHPTEGTTRSDACKRKIGQKRSVICTVRQQKELEGPLQKDHN